MILQIKSSVALIIDPAFFKVLSFVLGGLPKGTNIKERFTLDFEFESKYDLPVKEYPFSE